MILHVLTLDSSDGSYGGPVRVAREIVNELDALGFESRLIAGIHGQEQTLKNEDSRICNYPVRQLARKFPFSSLFSFSIARGLLKHIGQSRIVHIHLARDLIPFFAAFVCLAIRVPFVTQTHGMLDNETSITKKLIDNLFTKHILRFAKINFVLSKFELDSMKKKFPNALYEVIPNGIKCEDMSDLKLRSGKYKILFCSRLHPRKQPLLFIELAKSIGEKSKQYEFTIFGPDGGSLKDVVEALMEMDCELISYKGSIDSNKVSEVISEYDLLILPSQKEPFPMVVIEAMSVGVPVVVMADCGLAPKLKELPYQSICMEPSIAALTEVLRELQELNFLRNNREILIDCVKKEFNIKNICYSLLKVYYEE